jgi:uncharacterized protein YbaR (Trm112 family)
MDEKLLEILCCPETKQDLSIASESMVQKINEDIVQGKIVNLGGEKVEEEVQLVLIREDKKVGYLVRHDIPIMLVHEAISVA